MINRMVEVLERPGAYSRLVAGSALMRLFECRPEAMSERAARALVANTMRIAGEPAMLRGPCSWFLSGDLIVHDPAMVEVILPRVVMHIDGMDISLREELPRGWQGEEGRVEVDGKVIISTRQYMGRRPQEFAFPKFYLQPPEILGKHRLVSRVTLVTPNGIRIPLEGAVEFEVMDDKAWKDWVERQERIE
ncbi:MAG: hypothetical protein NTU94_11400 [Planctomycetota bacterium]|nr:hypothetical protein [Planctomycetota bacterium]